MLKFIGDMAKGVMSYFGGESSADAQREINAEKIAAQDRANALMLKDKENDRALQQQFAQAGIQWKVADAKAAGLNPYFALGASTPSYSAAPINIGVADIKAPDTGKSFEALGQMGQDLSRSFDKTSSPSSKVDSYTAAAQVLSLEKGSLENELLKSQIARLRQTSAPALPTASQRWLIPGQGEAPVGDIKIQPMEKTAADPERPFAEPGAITDVGYAKTVGGGYAPVPSKDVKERIEDQIIQEVMWSFRNQILPTLGINQAPPNVPVPKGYDKWLYHPFHQEYRPHKKKWGIHY